MRARWSVAVLALVALAACASPAAERADDAARSSFDHLLAIELTMRPADWTALRGETRRWADVFGACLAAPFASPYHAYDASVTIDGAPVGHARVRKRGFLGSLSEDKPSLRVTVDGALDVLDGGRHLLLNNAVQDPSYVRQCLAYRVFADAGVLAPRCGFARVRVNGDDLGVYVHVERVDAAFVARHPASAGATVYEGTFSDFRAGWTATFEREAGAPAAAAIDELTRALAAPDDALLAALAPRLDVDDFLGYWAAEVLVGQRDGYAGHANNFHVRLDSDGRFRFMPWGTDATFQPGPDPLGSGATALTARAYLPWRLHALPAIRVRYAARLRALLDRAWDEPALLAELDRLQALIAPAVVDAAALSARIDEVRAFVRGRRAAVLAELDAGLPSSLAPPLTAPCLDVVGDVDAALVTRWGTLGGDALAVGDATVTVNVAGAPLPITDAGAAAGVDPADASRGQLRIVATLAGGDAVLIVVQLDVAALRPSTTLELDGLRTTGYAYRYVPGAGLRLLGQVPRGTLELADAAPAAEAPLRARLRGAIVRLPDDRPGD